MRGKYDRAELDKLQVKSVVSDSRIWKAIVSLWPHISSNVQHILGNGSSTELWHHSWIEGNYILANDALDPTIPDDNHSLVADFTNSSGQWDIANLSLNLINKIRAILPPSPADSPGSFSWSDSPNGNFSVKSAYKLPSSSPNDNFSQDLDQTPWRHIWNWKGPHRIAVFVWIATHNKLMTALRRSKWSECQRCVGNTETVIHILRDCPFANAIWLELVDNGKILDFFTLFMVTCWFLWKWRNSCLFEEGFTIPANPLMIILCYVNQVCEALKDPHEKSLNSINSNTVSKDIACTFPPSNWIKLNTDGCSKGNPGDAGCGGLFRNCNGHWISGFSFHIGTCNAQVAELWAIYIGLCQAWNAGFKHIMEESDSLFAIQVINKVPESNLKHPLISKRKQLKSLQWEIVFRHTYREGNRCAELANWSLTKDYGLHEVTNPPPELTIMLAGDLSGASIPSVVHV